MNGRHKQLSQAITWFTIKYSNSKACRTHNFRPEYLYRFYSHRHAPSLPLSRPPAFRWQNGRRCSLPGGPHSCRTHPLWPDEYLRTRYSHLDSRQSLSNRTDTTAYHKIWPHKNMVQTIFHITIVSNMMIVASFFRCFILQALIQAQVLELIENHLGIHVTVIRDQPGFGQIQTLPGDQDFSCNPFLGNPKYFRPIAKTEKKKKIRKKAF